MKKLILIKHAPPLVDPAVPSEQWHLSEKGRELCGPLGEKLGAYGVGSLVSSVEPKAVQTAEELSRRLEVSHRTAEGLQEHDRSNVPHMRSGEFISMIELFFRRPEELVLGGETAREATDRIEAAIGAIAEQSTDDVFGVVSHGTVIALFLSRHNPDRRPFALWRELGLPSFAVLSLPRFAIEHIVAKVG